MRRLGLVFAALLLPATVSAQSDDPIGDLYDEERYDEAFALAQSRAVTGSALAHDWLGLLYEQGKGTPKDIAAARKNYLIAAQGGRNYARWRLGVLIDEGQIEGSLEQAVGYFDTCARDEYINCLVSLAVMQATGRGTPKDYSSAFQNYMRAAQMGDDGGIRGVGVMIISGEGVPKDLAEGAAWLLVSASLGNSQSEANLKTILDRIDDPDLAAIGLRAREIAASLGLPVDSETVIEDEATSGSPSN